MTRRRGTSDPSGAVAFSPVDNDAPLRWWRRLRIVPSGELGAGRRAVLAALVAWLPIAVWALATGRFASADTGEPLFQHYGIHVRYLVAIPLFILGEAALHRAGMAVARQFVASGAVTPDLVPRFEAANRSMVRLRDASLPWAFALAVAIAWSLADTPAPLDDAMSWAFRADGSLGFGGWWRPTSRARSSSPCCSAGCGASPLSRSGCGASEGSGFRSCVASGPHRRHRVRREAARRVRAGDARTCCGGRVALGARGRSPRRVARGVPAPGARLRRVVVAAPAAAPLRARTRA